MISEMVDAVVRYVEEEPTITLTEMKVRLIQDFPDSPSVTIQTISRRLDGRLITTCWTCALFRIVGTPMTLNVIDKIMLNG